MDVYARKLSGLEDKLACHFKLVTNMVRDGIKESMYDADGQTFFKR